MNRKILLDTNILLDAAMSERSGWSAAMLIFDEVANGKATGYVSVLSLKDAYYVLTKYAGESAAREYVSASLSAFELIGVDGNTCYLAVKSNESDFEDAIIRSCAEGACVDFIISRDEAAFLKSPIKRLSAQDYVNLFCEVEKIKLP